MKVEKTVYGGTKEILKYAEHYVAVPVMVDATGIVANSDGKKIVPAGTVVGGKTKVVLYNRQESVVSKNTAETGVNAEGVLLYDVEVTYGNAPGAMIIHGFIDATKLKEEPVSQAVAVLDMITFMK